MVAVVAVLRQVVVVVEERDALVAAALLLAAHACEDMICKIKKSRYLEQDMHRSKLKSKRFTTALMKKQIIFKVKEIKQYESSKARSASSSLAGGRPGKTEYLSTCSLLAFYM